MPAIFINYRTGDGEDTASLIYQELSRRFGRDQIFLASRSIPPGENYVHKLSTAVRDSKVLLAVIGSRWLTAVDGEGRNRLDDEDDWTRREILEAFEHQVRVLPVLVGDVKRLSPSDLPPTLAGLAKRQYRRLDHRSAEADLRELGDKLAELVPSLTDSDHPQQAVGSNTDDGGTSARLRAADHARQQVGTTNTMVNGDVGHLNSGSGHQFIGEGTVSVTGGNSGRIRQKFGSTPKRPDKR